MLEHLSIGTIIVDYPIRSLNTTEITDQEGKERQDITLQAACRTNLHT